MSDPRAPAAAESAAHLDAANPWPGLASFTEADHAWFRGRRAEAEELLRLVRRERLTVLFGRSGLGKSSLLNAGLFPRLRKERHLPVLLRIGYDAALSPRQQVWQALQAACAAAGVSAAAPAPETPLWQHFHRAGAGFADADGRDVLPVLVFDQFEEVFTLGQQDDTTRRAAAGFLDELADLVEDRPSESLRRAIEHDPALAETIDFERRGCKVVLSFREDFLAQVEGLRRRMPAVMRNRYRLLPMSAAQAREVIASGGDLVPPEVGERILGLAWRNQAAAPAAEDEEAIEVDPALLSVICSELNLRRRAEGLARIEPRLLDKAETEILRGFYERSLKGHPPALRHFIEDELITDAGYRDSYAFDDALARPGITREALMGLVVGRLLRFDERFGVRQLELTHDVLTRVVKDSRDERRALEAEAAALARVAAARRLQRRTAAVAGLALVVIGIAAAGAWQLRTSAAAAQRSAEAAQQALVSARTAAVTAQSELETTRIQVANSRQALEQAGRDQIRQSEQTALQIGAMRQEAAALLRETQATELILNARLTPPGWFDRALLLGAVAVDRYPDRLDGQLQQFARLLANPNLETLRRLDAPVTVTANSADGRWFVMGSDDGRIRLVDRQTARIQREWKEPRGYVSRIAIGSDGRWFATASGRDIALWRTDRDAPEHRSTMPVGRGGVTLLAVADDGSRVVVFGFSGTWLWRPGQPLVGLGSSGPQGACVRFERDGRVVLRGHDGYVASDGPTSARLGAVTPPGSYILGVSPDCSVDVIGPEKPPAGRGAVRLTVRRPLDGVTVGDVEARELGDSPSVSFVPGGRHFLLRTDERAVLFAIDPPKREHAFSIDRKAPDPDWSADGRWLAWRDERELVIEDVAARTERLRLRLAPEDQLLGVAFSPDGRFAMPLVAAANRRVGLVPVLRLQRPPGLGSGGKGQQASGVEFNRSGTVLITVQDGRFGFWNDRGQPVGEEPEISRSEFSPDGAWVALLGRSGRLRVRNLADPGRVVLERQLDAASMEQRSKVRLAVSDDNRALAVLLPDGRIEWHGLPDTGQPPRVLARDATLREIAISPDGRWLAAGGENGVITLFAITGPAPARRLPEPHARGIRSLRFSPDGRWLASGGDDLVALVHDVASGRRIATFDEPHRDPIDRLSWLEDGRVLLSGREKGTSHLWDVRRGRWLGELGGEGSGVDSVDLSPRERRAAVLDADGRVSLRRWDRGAIVEQTCAIAGRNLECAEWRQYVPGLPYRVLCPSLPAPVPACH